MRALELRHPTGITPILISHGGLSDAVQTIADDLIGRKVFVVTSPAVHELHGQVLAAALTDHCRPEVLQVPDGEAAKNIETATGLWREILRGGGKRDSVVIAFGGGSVGDLAGFVAATFMRGVGLVQIPTTLLAQVDAAIGGKTAINLPTTKNAVGAFHHPLAVLSDPRLLHTLPDRDFRAGLFEVIKTATMLDETLFGALEGQLDGVLDRDSEAVEEVVAATSAAKARVVEGDPQEAGRRQFLNFGHTLGHALEIEAGPEALRHGEAVGFGMLFALKIAESRGLSEDSVARCHSLIHRVGLPPLPSLDLERVVQRIWRDKKNRETGLTWVIPRCLGSGESVTDLSAEEVHDRVKTFLGDA